VKVKCAQGPVGRATLSVPAHHFQTPARAQDVLQTGKATARAAVGPIRLRCQLHGGQHALQAVVMGQIVGVEGRVAVVGEQNGHPEHVV
jgi:hypothetical protein